MLFIKRTVVGPEGSKTRAKYTLSFPEQIYFVTVQRWGAFGAFDANRHAWMHSSGVDTA